MAYQIIADKAFRADYKNVKRRYPEVIAEFKSAVAELAATGTVPDSYNPHPLNNFGGNYNGHYDFHLSDGKVDVVVLYLPHKTNPSIRLVRIGAHSDLFQGPMR